MAAGVEGKRADEYQWAVAARSGAEEPAVTFPPSPDSTSKNYSDTTPDVTYTYYTSGAPKIGRLASVSNSVSTTNYLTYDALGRVLTSRQSTDSTDYDFTYSYKPIGLDTMTYPAIGTAERRTVSYTYDVAGRAISVSSGGTTYANNVSYAPHGAIESMTLGNGKVEQSCYNARLQVAGIRLGSSIAGNCSEQTGDLMALGFGYVSGGQTTKNNGNLHTQTIARPGLSAINQGYGYDGFNRLISATETNGWTEGYAYDTYGNRWVTQHSGTGMPALTLETPVTSSWYSNGNNQITGWDYDDAGNVTSVSNMSRAFEYDAENRQTSATINSAETTYYYDGEGRRVKKVLPSGATTVYVYDAMGQLAREDGGTPESGTRYLTRDHLGSTRLETDATGNPVHCYDYLPFGGEIPQGVNSRSTCYNEPPEGPEKFTAKERDHETGLDYFGARYFASAMGRFTTVDPLMASAKASNPQTWNRYAYTLNNPLRYIDPDGLEVPDECAKDPDCAIQLNVNLIYSQYANDLGGLTSGQKEKAEAMQTEANAVLANANVHVVTTEAPAGQTSEALTDSYSSDSLNLLMDDKVATGGKRGVSGYAEGDPTTAITAINVEGATMGKWIPGMWSPTLVHEYGEQALHVGQPKGDPLTLPNFRGDIAVDRMMNGVRNQRSGAIQDFRQGIADKRYAVPLNPKANEPQE